MGCGASSEGSGLGNAEWESLGLKERPITPPAEELQYSERDKLPSAGSTGPVYQGRFKGQDVAIKIFRFDLSAMFKDDREAYRQLCSTVVAEFKREVEIMMRLEHPCIMRTMGFTTNPELISIHIFAQRGSLHRVIARKLWQPGRAAQLTAALDMARGLGFLHEQDIIHRDMKSTNVLVTENFRLKLSDIGQKARHVVTRVRCMKCAENVRVVSVPTTGGGGGSWKKAMKKMAIEGPSQQSRMVSLVTDAAKAARAAAVAEEGSMLWSAPEKLSGKTKHSLKIDIFGWAVVVNELLSGRQPWAEVKGMKPENVSKAVRAGKRTEVPMVNTEPLLRDIVQQCWAQVPENRSNMRTVVSRLRAAVKAKDIPYNNGEGKHVAASPRALRGGALTEAAAAAAKRREERRKEDDD